MNMKFYQKAVIACIFVGCFLSWGGLWAMDKAWQPDPDWKCQSPAERYPKGAVYLETDLCPLWRWMEENVHPALSSAVNSQPVITLVIYLVLAQFMATCLSVWFFLEGWRDDRA